MHSFYSAREIVVFIVGGFTYEEAAAVHRRNQEGGARIILGGTEVHNTTTYAPASGDPHQLVWNTHAYKRAYARHSNTRARAPRFLDGLEKINSMS